METLGRDSIMDLKLQFISSTTERFLLECSLSYFERTNQDFFTLAKKQTRI